jgi:hypothetical protein
MQVIDQLIDILQLILRLHILSLLALFFLSLYWISHGLPPLWEISLHTYPTILIWICEKYLDRKEFSLYYSDLFSHAQHL